MKYDPKYARLYFAYIIAIIILVLGTGALKDKNISFQKEILIKQAQTHFRDQVNNRNWNAKYAGVYVKPLNDEKPNPFLKDNIIKTESGERLLRINPSLMIKQLASLSTAKGLHFRITSLHPINPENIADSFETKALNHIIDTKEEEYYELASKHTFRYVGALVSTKECLACHSEKDYSIGSIVGGISINLDSSSYENIVAYIEDKVLKLRVLIALLLLSIVFLIHKQYNNNRYLQEEVGRRTKEITETKLLLQEILDSDKSLLMVFDKQNIILANKTMLEFFGFDSLDDLKKEHKDISDLFEHSKRKEYLTTYIGQEYWIDYLYKEQDIQECCVLIKKGGENRHFRPHIKEVIVKEQKLYIVTFDEITKSLEQISHLKEKASKDALTNLFNRGKFDNVIVKEIESSQVSGAPLSIIFLDIDHFKRVNDTYGHDVGDKILQRVADILVKVTREGDFIARWGGEEFVIALHATDLNRALSLAQKIRKEVESYEFETIGSLTISLGVCECIMGEELESLMKRVDAALYEAKESGRNKVVGK